MAKILTTKGLAAELENTIRNAKTEIFLISYSFKMDETYINRIKQASDSNVKIRLIFGEKVNAENLKDLNNIANIQVLKYAGLHAKIFANEYQCIIGSMNFYDYSEQHNTELGCLITAKDDTDAFKDALQHCNDIYKWATEEPRKTPNILINSGYCIRTGVVIPFNKEKPMCYEAFKAWEKYRNREYPENFCHFTGEISNGETCMSKPILNKNLSKAHEVYSF